MISSIENIIELHKNNGDLSEAYKRIHLDEKIFDLNIYTLRIIKGNTNKEEIKKWNAIISREIRKDINLHKEIKEYILVFELFKKLKILKGYIQKSEIPDFIYYHKNKKTGIEVTNIYVGNDWVAEKLKEEIPVYKLKSNDLPGYIEYKRYYNRIKTYNIKGNIVIKPIIDKIFIEDYISQIKNKIFEKIRKLAEEYYIFDNNIIFASIISSHYFNSEEQFNKLNEELKYYISHLELSLDKSKSYELILKTKYKWVKFNIKDGTYRII